MSVTQQLKSHLNQTFDSWVDDEIATVLSLVEVDPSARLLDLGCGDGRITKLVAEKSKARATVGMEALRMDGLVDIDNFKLASGDLNEPFPFDDTSFDVVLSHFSIEHLYNPGLFIQESYRVLKKDGYTIVATDNLSAWPNVFALSLGWQPFSTTTGIGRRAMGNPLALRSASHGEFSEDGELAAGNVDAWRTHGKFSHNKVLAYRMLREAYQEFGFEVEELLGAGYLVFGGRLGQALAKVDPRHSHLLVLKARKT